MRELHWEEIALSQKMFAGAALHDHVVARWAFFNGVYRHFTWNACQAIEKYLKCIILLNSCEQIKHNHNNPKFLKIATECSSGLIQDKFDLAQHSLPSRLIDFPYSRDEGCQETTEHYISRLDSVGNVDTRYRQANSRVLPLDLIKLDVLCNVLRRLCVPLRHSTPAGEIYLDLLLKDSNFDPEHEFAALNKSRYLKSPDLQNLFERHNIAISSNDSNEMDYKFSWDSSEIVTSAMTTNNREIIRQFLSRRFHSNTRLLGEFNDALSERDTVQRVIQRPTPDLGEA